MKINLSFILAGLLMCAGTAFAGNGDLIVDGNVGIGTSTPSNKLTIDVGSSRNGISLFSDGDESVYSDILMAVKTPASVPAGQPTYFISSFRKDGYFSGGAATGPSLEFYVVRQGGGYYAPLSFKGNGDVILASNSNAASGNIGIGTTTPEAKLAILGDPAGGFSRNDGMPRLWFKNNQSGAKWQIGTYGGAGVDDFTIGAYSGVTGNITLTSTGNVGIGTITPGAYKLFVAGTAYSTGGWQGSDARFKKNLLPINDPIGNILKLTGLSYEWKTDEYKDKGFPEGRHYGVIAQEVEKVLPEVVSTAPDGTKAVAYTEIIPVLIEAIKEQQKLIEKQQSRIESLERMH